jgi:hypothetical protein
MFQGLFSDMVSEYSREVELFLLGLSFLCGSIRSGPLAASHLH